MAAQTNRDACGAPSVPGTRRPSRWPASSGASTETRTTPTGYAEVHIGADPNPAGAPNHKSYLFPSVLNISPTRKRVVKWLEAEQNWTRRLRKRQPKFGAYASSKWQDRKSVV